MPRRSDARKSALQMLYLLDQNPDTDIEWVRQSLNQDLEKEILVEFAWRLFTGVREQQAGIDEKIATVADNWRVDRMAPTDRNVIRLGAYEMTHLETPAAVVLNECVELAKEFGAENSPSFVNGILDKLCPATTEETPDTDSGDQTS